MIRNYRKTDADAVIDLWIRSNRVGHPFVDAGFWAEFAPTMRAEYLPNSATRVWEQDGAVMAFLSVVPDIRYLAALFVDPSLLRSGIGTVLMQDAQKVWDELWLKCYTGNERAARFYEKHGFAVEKEQIDEKTGFPEYIMRWRRK